MNGKWSWQKLFRLPDSAGIGLLGDIGIKLFCSAG